MHRPTTPMLYYVPAHGDRIHRGRPSRAFLREMVRDYPLAWVIA
jgi:hypothetical protein